MKNFWKLEPQKVRQCLKHKNMLETIKRKFKRNYYLLKILKYKSNSKKAWNIMKEVIGKINKSVSRLPTKLLFTKNTSI